MQKYTVKAQKYSSEQISLHWFGYQKRVNNTTQFIRIELRIQGKTVLLSERTSWTTCISKNKTMKIRPSQFT